jgi:hypothetical protein
MAGPEATRGTSGEPADGRPMRARPAAPLESTPTSSSAVLAWLAYRALDAPWAGMTTASRAAAAVGLGAAPDPALVSLSPPSGPGCSAPCGSGTSSGTRSPAAGASCLPEAMVLPARSTRRPSHRRGAARRARALRAPRPARPRGARRLAIPDALHPLIAESGTALQLARYDLFPTEDGRWMVSEFNEDVPGGFNEAALPDLSATPAPGSAGRATCAPFVDAFRGYETRGAALRDGVLGGPPAHADPRAVAAEAGHRTVLGSPAHLRRGAGAGRGCSASRWTRRSASTRPSGCRGSPTSGRGSGSGRGCR